MKTDRKSRNNSRKAPFIASLALACAMVAGNASAGIPVTDVGNGAAHWTNSISTYISKIEQFAEHAKEYTREFERIRNLATQASSLISNLSALTLQDPQPRSLNYGMSECDPDFSGFSLSDLFQLIAPSLSSSIPEQQRTICKHRIRLRNEKYNENVRITRIVKQRMNEIQSLSSSMRGSSTTGTNQTNLNQGAVLLNQLIADIQYSETIVRIYDNSIASLDDDDRALAKQALSGKKKGLGESLLSTAAQTASLCAGMMVAKSDGSDFSCGL